MSFTPSPLLLVQESRLNWTELALSVSDDNPDNVVIAFPFYDGRPFGGARILNTSSPVIRIPREIFPPFVSFVGAKSDNQKAYIALNVDLANDVIVEIVAVDESGATSGGGGGDASALAHIAGTVQIDGSGAEREIVVISNDRSGERKVLASGFSGSDGSFDITYEDWLGSVIALALDDYGVEWAPEANHNMGAVIHPVTPNGHVYVVTEAGTTGTEEPAWSTTDSVQSGSVTLSPRPFYRPVASGPLKGELIGEADLWTPADVDLSIWYDASIPENTIESGFVATLSDASGSANHASQGTAAHRLVAGADTLNNLPVFQNTQNASESFYQFSAFPLTVDVMMVLRTNQSNAVSLLGNTDDAYLPIGDSTSNSEWRRDVGTPSVEVDGLEVTVSTRNASRQAIIQDRWIILNFKDVDMTLVNRIFAGANEEAFYFKGLWAEAIFSAGGGFDTATKQKAEGYLAHKWGITGNLYESHPYRYIPPLK